MVLPFHVIGLAQCTLNIPQGRILFKGIVLELISGHIYKVYKKRIIIILSRTLLRRLVRVMVGISSY